MVIWVWIGTAHKISNSRARAGKEREGKRRRSVFKKPVWLSSRVESRVESAREKSKVWGRNHKDGLKISMKD